jgi:small ligand-binding sensory domain FIST
MSSPDQIPHPSSQRDGVPAPFADDPVRDSSQATFLIPSPAFSNYLDDLLKGFGMHLPENNANIVHTLTDGCVGVVMSGDIKVETMIAQGSKPVGGVYKVEKGQDTTISAIALDDTAKGNGATS